MIIGEYPRTHMSLRFSRPRLVCACLVSWCLRSECCVRVVADWSEGPKGVIWIIRGWVTTVAHHKWMGAKSLKVPVYVWTMGLVTVCFQIVIKALVVGVLEGLCEFAVMYSNQSLVSTIPQSREGLCAILNLNCSSYETYPLELCAPKRSSCTYLISCCDFSTCTAV